MIAAVAASGLAACASIGPHASLDEGTSNASHYALRLLGTQSFASGLQYGGTTVGGLSGIDYDPATGRYVLISDDRSHDAPTRFYVASLQIDASGFHAATLDGVVPLRRPDGSTYPENAADAEAIRYDARTRSVWWTSEGMRKLGPSKRTAGMQLVDPFIRQSTLDGRHLGEVPLAPMFHITAEPRGPRDNLVFEGLTLAVDGQSLWVSMEGPLLQDGPMATMADGAWSRVSRYDRLPDGGFGALAAQYAYRIDPIPSRGAWTSAYAQTGVSEILAVDATRFFVLERARVLGEGWRIRLFEADLDGASDVKALDSLVAEGVSFTGMTKALVLDFDTLGVPIDNLEGMCLGPTLVDGHRTLVLVADDNFSGGQSTQLMALEILDR